MKTVVTLMCWLLLITGAAAQETVIYDIISTMGIIIDKRSGKELQIGETVNFQTDLQFNSLHDRAVLLDSEKVKYFLGLPKSSFANSQLTIASSEALTPVKPRPTLITSVRGSSILITNGVSPQNLREYFAVDTFTVVGNRLALPVTRQDREKFDLMLRYETENSVEEYISTDFTIDKKDLKIQGNGIPECFVLLREGRDTVAVTQMSLFFVEEAQLFREFDSLLKAMNQTKDEKDTTLVILRQYCADVYGVIDRTMLETTINNYLTLK